MKVHIHDDQLDGHRYARCGRVQADDPSIKLENEFEAAEPRLRCTHCDRWWFPYGQPDWHLEQARKAFHNF